MATIVDLTRLSAAYAPRLLVEAGHRVIRIESPAGDDVRRHGPFLGGKLDLEHGAVHHFVNAGKESLTLDAGSERGAALVLELVRRADAAIVSRPANVGSEAIRAANPSIVLIDVEDLPNELIAYAKSGLLAITGHADRSPVMLGGHAAYSAIGMYVAIAATAALFGSARTGEGAHVEVGALHALEALAEQGALEYHTTGRLPSRRGARGAITAISGAFKCADGYWMISVPHGPEGWKRFAEWIDDPELNADPKLAEESHRRTRRDLVLDRIAAWSRNRRKDDLVREAQERHVPASPVATAVDLADDPQLIARGFLADIEHPEFGKIRFPMGATATAKGIRVGPAPRLGEHTGAILAELGFSQTEQRALFESGIV